MSARAGITHARALEIHEDLVAWLRSSKARRAFFGEAMLSNAMDGRADLWSLVHERRLFEQAGEQSRVLELQGLERCVPTFCTASFGDVVEEMCRHAPSDAMVVDDVPEEYGLLVFEKPLVIQPRREVDDDEVEHPRAISWTVVHVVRRGVPESWVKARIWSETKPYDPDHVANRMAVASRTTLYPSSQAASPLTGSRDHHADFAPMRVLRTAFALMATPSARVEREHRDTRLYPRTTRSTTDDIRRIYLRHPESSAQEAADSARQSARDRAPVRLHWVHWYWQNHWYPKAHTHRWILIDDYVRGHPEQGWADRRTIRIADE